MVCKTVSFHFGVIAEDCISSRTNSPGENWSDSESDRTSVVDGSEAAKAASNSDTEPVGKDKASAKRAEESDSRKKFYMARCKQEQQQRNASWLTLHPVEIFCDFK